MGKYIWAILYNYKWLLKLFILFLEYLLVYIAIISIVQFSVRSTLAFS